MTFHHLPLTLQASALGGRATLIALDCMLIALDCMWIAGEHSEGELRQRFHDLDADGSGKVDMQEYIRWCLHDAICRR